MTDLPIRFHHKCSKPLSIILCTHTLCSVRYNKIVVAEIFAAESPVYEMGKIGKHDQSSNIRTGFANDLF